MSAPIIRACSPTDASSPGHAIVIVHYLDTTTNIRTFFIAQESSYVETPKRNASGAVEKNSRGRVKTTGFRAVPPTALTNANRYTHAMANGDFSSATNHIVLRENIRTAGKWKYTIQRVMPTSPWGFPKGSGKNNSEDAKAIAKREFFEEVGYTLNDSRLIFKKCVEVSRWDRNIRDTIITQSVVFHYEVNSVGERDAVKAAFTAKHAAHHGELFNADFHTEATILGLPKNEFSRLAFQNFAADLAAAVDQTTIPRGGIVLPQAPVPVPAPIPATAATAFAKGPIQGQRGFTSTPQGPTATNKFAAFRRPGGGARKRKTQHKSRHQRKQTRKSCRK
jgi:8-oxo-dGTP pyrophosphatase MutT (NUDIX family)